MDVPAAPRPHSKLVSNLIYSRILQINHYLFSALSALHRPITCLESCLSVVAARNQNRRILKKNEKPIQTSVQKQKPRPLMDNVITTPTSSLKEKSTQSNRQKSNAPATKKSSSNSSSSPRKSRPAMTAYQPPLQYPSSPRDLHLVSSTPSSRSSSSMSSSGIAPQISPTLTVSSPRVLHVKGGPQKYSLPRPNAFAPMIAQSDEKECICDRKNTHVVCKRCGYECVGRVQVTCGQHPMILALNDLRECPNPVCHSVQLLEFDEFGNEDVHDDTIEQLLAEPIEKIDLQS